MSTLSISDPVAFHIEAEDMILDNYLVEESDVASNGKLISLLNAAGDDGTASISFTGPPGIYTVVVAYFDDIDGEAILRLKVNDTLIDSWQLDQHLDPEGSVPTRKNFTRRTIGDVSLNAGDLIVLEGERDNSDWARVDFIKVILQGEAITKKGTHLCCIGVDDLFKTGGITVAPGDTFDALVVPEGKIFVLTDVIVFPEVSTSDPDFHFLYRLDKQPPSGVPTLGLQFKGVGTENDWSQHFTGGITFPAEVTIQIVNTSFSTGRLNFQLMGYFIND